MLKQASLSIGIMLSTCFASTVFAAQDGLGSSWPNKPDVSNNPHWHVYVFSQSGVKYIQVNELDGTVREAVATANGQFLVLPMGIDAPRVSTSSDRATNTSMNSVRMQTAMASSQQVYSDGAVTITVSKDAGGNLFWSNTSTNVINADSCEAPNCGNVNQQPTGH